MAQYPSQFPPPPPGGYPAPQQPGGYAPPPSGGYPAPQQPGGYAPPQMPGGYPAPQAPGGYPAPQQPGGYAPPQMPGGYPAPQQSGGYATPQVPGSYPALPVPPEIAQQVATYQLGTLAQTYQANLVKLLLVVGVALLATLLVIPAASAGSGGILVLLIMLAATAYAIYYFVVNFNVKAYVFSEGLIRAKGSQVDVMRWEHVEAVWERVIQYRYRGLIPLYKTYNYTLRRNDGAQFKFSSALKSAKLLGEAIQQEVTRRQLPKAIATYDSGAPANFGTLSVSTQGINKGAVLTPWNQIGQVNFRNGWLIVHKQGSLFAASRTRASSIPNLQVFLQLVEHGRRRATGGY